MSTAHVYQIFISATPTQVWRALVESEWTERYFHGTRFDGPLTAGRPYRTTLGADGPGAVDGTVEELQPPTDGAPGRFVITWHVLYDAALAAEQPGRVEWTVAAAGDGLTRVRLVHGDLGRSPLTWAHVRDGWVWVLDSLKTILETGTPLPAWVDPTADPAEEGAVDSLQQRRDDVAADDHRAQGIAANNSTWDLIEQLDQDPASSGPSRDDQSEAVLRGAYAAAYHWERASGRTPANAVRADCLIAQAQLLAGRPDLALRAADRAWQRCTELHLGDFDLAYTLEARARALRELGRSDETATAWAEATAVTIANDEDRAQVEHDFAGYPG